MRRFLLSGVLALLAAFWAVCALAEEARPLALPQAAAAKPGTTAPAVVRVKLDDTLRLEGNYAHAFEDLTSKKDSFIKLRNALAPELCVGRFRFGTRLELTYYPNSLVERPGDSTGNNGIFGKYDADDNKLGTIVSRNDLRFEKVYGVYESPSLRVELGDSYTTFGRGLVLSMRKRGEDEIDNTLRGGKIDYRFKNYGLTLVGGLTNVLNFDSTRERMRADPNDFIGGLRLEGRFLDLFTLGLQGVEAVYGATMSSETRSFLREKRSTLAGLTLDFPLIAKVLALYAEADYLYREERVVSRDTKGYEGRGKHGYGLYASVNAYIRDLTLTGEYKLYHDFIFRPGRGSNTYSGQTKTMKFEVYDDILYNDQPTLERQDLDLSGTYYNDQGARLKLEYNVRATNTRPYAALYYDRREDPDYGTTDNRTWHAYGGVTQYFGPIEFIADLGYRDERDQNAGRVLKRYSHAKLSIVGPLVPGHTLGFEGQYLRKDEASKRHASDIEDFVLTYTMARAFSLSFFYTLEHQDYLPSDNGDSWHHLFAGEIRSRFSQSVEFSIFGGQIREGVRCYGGACKKIPAFEGVKGKLIVHL